MLLKKSAMLAAVLALTSAPFAHATLTTHNKTDLYSTVLLDNGECAGSKGKFTNPNSDLFVSNLEVRAICHFASKCGATVIMSKDASEIKQCHGDKIGYAILDTGSITVEKLRNDDAAHYDLQGQGGSELTIIALAK
jgi:hypothetical protein